MDLVVVVVAVIDGRDYKVSAVIHIVVVVVVVAAVVVVVDRSRSSIIDQVVVIIAEIDTTYSLTARSSIVAIVFVVTIMTIADSSMINFLQIPYTDRAICTTTNQARS